MAELVATQRKPGTEAAPALTEETDLRSLLTALLDDRTESARPDADVAPQSEIDRRLQFAAAHPKSAGHQKRHRQQRSRSTSLHDSLNSRSESRPTSMVPSLVEIDAFMDERARVTGMPAWGSLQPLPTAGRERAGVLSDIGGAAAQRSALRPALVATALGVCMVAVWFVLR